MLRLKTRIITSQQHMSDFTRFYLTGFSNEYKLFLVKYTNFFKKRIYFGPRRRFFRHSLVWKNRRKHFSPYKEINFRIFSVMFIAPSLN